MNEATVDYFTLMIISHQRALTVPHKCSIDSNNQPLTRHHYPLPEWASWQTVLWTPLKNTWGSIKNLYPYISCPVTRHQVTFRVWKMIGHHCGGWENLAVSWLAVRWRGEFSLSYVNCSCMKLILLMCWALLSGVLFIQWLTYATQWQAWVCTVLEL